MKRQVLPSLLLLPIKRFFAFFFFLLSIILNAVAQFGSPYPPFGSNGQVITDLGGNSGATGTAVQSDGKIIVAGYYSLSTNSKRDFVLVRYNINGSFDPSFGNGGKVFTEFVTGNDDVAAALVIQSDGKIVVAGTTADNRQQSLSKFALARYN